jgi:BirA family biotin operon repressor/biotin-[acetyl-CoA-carboxylase] ligase
MLSDPAPHDRYPELSFVAALAVHDAITGRIPGLSRRVLLKWPNDLLIDRNKFAGILVEAEGANLVIGIGVNCMHHPTGTDYPATDLATAGVRTTPESLFSPLTAAMIARLAQWRRGEDFSSVRAEWLARAGGLGKSTRVKIADGEVTGLFEGIDDSGHMVLRAADGTVQALAAGDVMTAAR